MSAAALLKVPSQSAESEHGGHRLNHATEIIGIEPGDIDTRRIQHVHRLLFSQPLRLLDAEPQKREHAMLGADKTEVLSSRCRQRLLELTTQAINALAYLAQLGFPR